MPVAYPHLKSGRVYSSAGVREQEEQMNEYEQEPSVTAEQINRM